MTERTNIALFTITGPYAPNSPADTRPDGGMSVVTTRGRQEKSPPARHEVRTFLLTDLADSTVLWDKDPAAMSAALAHHDQLVADLVTGAGGSLIRTKGEGDSTFSVFTDPVAAVVTARLIVDTLAGSSWPTPRPLVARVGAHVGPAERRGVNWFGSTVNRAARIRSLTPAGEVLVSGTLAGVVGDGLRNCGP
jgi:class 3 adenylate cyclase